MKFKAAIEIATQPMRVRKRVRVGVRVRDMVIVRVRFGTFGIM